MTTCLYMALALCGAIFRMLAPTAEAVKLREVGEEDASTPLWYNRT
jgi:hypothetical protein